MEQLMDIQGLRQFLMHEERRGVPTPNTAELSTIFGLRDWEENSSSGSCTGNNGKGHVCSAGSNPSSGKQEPSQSSPQWKTSPGCVQHKSHMDTG